MAAQQIPGHISLDYWNLASSLPYLFELMQTDSDESFSLSIHKPNWRGAVILSTWLEYIQRSLARAAADVH